MKKKKEGEGDRIGYVQYILCYTPAHLVILGLCVKFYLGLKRMGKHGEKEFDIFLNWGGGIDRGVWEGEIDSSFS